MICPKCGESCKVIDSRKPSGDRTIRRYGCVACGHRYSTVEVPAELSSSAGKLYPTDVNTIMSRLIEFRGWYSKLTEKGYSSFYEALEDSIRYWESMKKEEDND
jgi:hypothetical protein